MKAEHPIRNYPVLANLADDLIDKVWVGMEADWDYDFVLEVIRPDDVIPPVGLPFVVAGDPEARAGENGYRVIHRYNAYSDHSPAMVVLKTSQVP